MQRDYEAQQLELALENVFVNRRNGHRPSKISEAIVIERYERTGHPKRYLIRGKVLTPHQYSKLNKLLEKMKNEQKAE